MMRSNSGSGKSQNNRGNPALEEHEQAGGTSGEAITGARKSDRPADRTESRTGSGKR